MSDQHENPLLLPGERLEPSRRAFLELAGFGLSAVGLSACSRGPATRLIPALAATEGVVAGRAYWVATSCGACSARCGVLAKCRDGRPIKLEGNPSDALTHGGLCATGQANVLSLYDSRRLDQPRRGTAQIGWDEVDAEVRRALEVSGRVRLLTGTENGPSTRAAVDRFLAAYPNAKHVAYDALSRSALLDAHERLFGVRALPSLRFERARAIVSFGADFLGTWIAPVTYARDYARGRQPELGSMSTHVQLEAMMSLTGTVADRRIGLRPSQTAGTLAGLCTLLAHKAGEPARHGAKVSDEHAELLGELASLLWNARGQSLVVCGQNDLDAQLHAAYANQLLGNYGETLSIGRPSLQSMGDDKALWTLKEELDAGVVDCLIISGVNPGYELPRDFGASIAKAGLTIRHGAQEDETSALAQLVLPAPHSLEAWGDAEPESGRFGLQQPTIPRVRDARTLRRMLSAWIGDEREDLDLLRTYWKEQLHERLAGDADFDSFFQRALHDGYIEDGTASREPAFVVDGLRALDGPKSVSVEAAGTDIELVLYPKVGLLDGSQAHNPWLQELPNPVTKVSWDNYVSLAPSSADELEVGTGDVVRIQVDDVALELPVWVQRGQLAGVAAVALGYGRSGTDRFSDVGPRWLEGKRTVEPGETVGANAAPLLGFDAGGLRYERSGVRIEKTGARVDIAATQDHHSLEVPAHLAPRGGEVRDAVHSLSFADFAAEPQHERHGAHKGHAPGVTELWPADHEPQRHHWGMAVDLTSCTGCSACVISCQAENNIPVVGKDETRRHREMHWMRIDRYFEGVGEDVSAAHQPMFCQQCDNAPCESVCPVLATVHSTEGLNSQVYNRCVGTRYCANTCPYKVRRFNWFDYPREDKLENHALNPDVTIRSRGVMEKCSFCSQRIQEARSEALRRGVALADGDIQTACQQSCPTQAIVFGDMLDPESSVSKIAGRRRAYRVLEELNVKPSVSYLARIRSTPAAEKHDG